MGVASAFSRRSSPGSHQTSCITITVIKEFLGANTNLKHNPLTSSLLPKYKISHICLINRTGYRTTSESGSFPNEGSLDPDFKGKSKLYDFIDFEIRFLLKVKRNILIYIDTIYIHIYMHICIHTYMHVYKYTYIHISLYA